MSINIGPPSVEELRPRITVVGVGGAGGNAIANMIRAGIEGVDFVVANTDAQALNASIAEHRIQLGPISRRALAPVRGPRLAVRRRKKPSSRSSARWKACTCASSLPAWVAAPAPAPRR
jgi:hypothetical protein